MKKENFKWQKCLLMFLVAMLMLPTQMSFAADENNIAKWEIAPQSLQARTYYSKTFVIDNILYSVSGECNASTATEPGNIDAYNPVTNKWTMKTPMPLDSQPIQFTPFEHKGLIYFIGGTSSNGIVVFDPKGKDGKGSWALDKEKLPVKMLNPDVVAVGDYLYVSQGTAFYRYDIKKDLWTSLSTAKGARAGCPAMDTDELFCVGDDLYVGTTIGGYSLSKYNMENNIWEEAGTSAPKRMYVFGKRMVIGEKIYYIGGSDSGAPHTDTGNTDQTLLQAYNTKTRKWEVLESMNVGRSTFGAVNYNNEKIYVIGGYASKTNKTSKVEVYDIKKDQWEITTSLSAPRAFLEANIVDGKIYALLGLDDTKFTTKTEVYVDPNWGNGSTTNGGNNNSGNNNSGNNNSGNNNGGNTNGGNTNGGTVNKGNRGILEITMSNGDRKEFDLTVKEINDFVTWYYNRTAGNAMPYYVINKNYNLGGFSARTEHIVYDKISSFEIKEYNK